MLPTANNVAGGQYDFGQCEFLCSFNDRLIIIRFCWEIPENQDKRMQIRSFQNGVHPKITKASLLSPPTQITTTKGLVLCSEM